MILNVENVAVENRYGKMIRFRYLILSLLVVLILISGFFDFILGPDDISISNLIKALTSPDEVDLYLKITVWELRLPYALMAIAVGLALGLAGAEMQTILNNPLASPFTLGLSNAAAFGAALAIVADISLPGIPGQWIISANAFLFSILAALLLDFLTRYSKISSSGIVLFGIALVFSFNALVSLMQFVASEDKLQGLVMWTMGNVTRNATKVHITAMFIVFVVVLIWSMLNSWKLTALRLGEDRAISFGINTKKLRLTTLIRISFASATAVALVGPIGFIGLVAPHISRILFGEDHRFYLPASALIGALILSVASIASKNLFHGVVVPVGIVTSLVGVPFFLFIVLKFKERVG
ncbi:MAG: FecCD family ABC transporter permease [Campylobacteraceae bacterium]